MSEHENENQVTYQLNASQEKTSVTPGQWLRSAREAIKLTQNDVAKELNLSQQVIVNIEQDNYQKVGSFLFVRGYLRNYARLVRLSGDDVVRLFNEMNLTEEVSSSVRIGLQQRQAPAQQQNLIRLVTTGIVIGLVVLVAVWWHLQHKADTRSVLSSAAKSELSAKKNSLTQSDPNALQSTVELTSNITPYTTLPAIDATAFKSTSVAVAKAPAHKGMRARKSRHESNVELASPFS